MISLSETDTYLSIRCGSNLVFVNKPLIAATDNPMLSTSMSDEKDLTNGVLTPVTMTQRRRSCPSFENEDDDDVVLIDS